MEPPVRPLPARRLGLHTAQYLPIQHKVPSLVLPCSVTVAACMSQVQLKRERFQLNPTQPNPADMT
jgi:hypothetical protein